MKQNKLPATILFSAITAACLPMAAFANSSWHWLTTSPMTLLPFAIVVTLLIETGAIAGFARIINLKKVFFVVLSANLLSFLAPYVERAWRFIPTSGGFRLTSAFEKGPYFIVLAGYLLLTLLMELPVTYLLLRKDTQKRKMLAASILVSNIITTLAVGLIERLLCIGSW